MQYTEEQIQNKFDNLPKDVREVISSTDTTNKIIDIAQHYKIHIDKIEQIVSEITLFMLGLEKLDSLKSNLRDKTGMSRELIDAVIKDIDEQVFSNIRTSIRQIQLVKEEEKPDNVRPAERINNGINIPQHQEKDLPMQKEKTPTFPQTNPQILPDPGFNTNLTTKIPTPTPVKTSGEPIISREQQIEREQILKEIENPLTETKKQPEPLVNTIPPNLPNETVLEKPTEIVTKPSFPIGKTIPKTPQPSIIESKLNNVVKVPIQEKNISEELPKKTNVVDPYREPID